MVFPTLHTNVGPVLEVFERFLASSHGFETQRPWAFDDAPVSDTICVHVVLALYLKQSRSAKVLGRTRSVAVTNTGIKTCQVEYFQSSHKPQNLYFRLGEMIVFENMHQNKGLTNGLKNHIKTCQVELVWEFSKTSKMVVSSRRNACF